jgi:hypothetical protein
VLILVAACVLAAAAWVYLLAGHGGFWRTDVRLPGPPGSPGPQPWPSVVAVVPARDEAAILPETLPTLLAQEYPGAFSVVLVDDASTDGTAAVAAAVSTRAAAGSTGALAGPTRAAAGSTGTLAGSTEAAAGSAPVGVPLRVVSGGPPPRAGRERCGRWPKGWRPRGV